MAWEQAGVLHRDISLGNILISDDPADDGCQGFIHDFDYSSMTSASPEAHSADEQTDPESSGVSILVAEDYGEGEKERTVSS